MRLFALLSLISCAIFLYMGSFIYYQDQRNRLNRSFWWMCLFMSLWAFSEFMYRQTGSPEAAYFWIKVRAISWALPLTFLLYFILIFTEKTKLLRHRASGLIIFAPALVFSALDLFTDLLTGKPIMRYWGYTYGSPSYSWVYWTSVVWTMGITLLALLLSLQYLLTVTEERKKRQAQNILIGISLPILAGILTEIALPVFQISLPELTNTSGIWLAIFVGYAIRKYELFTLSPAAASDNIISTMTDSLILMDPSGKIVTANKATLDLLGYEEREVIGQAADKVFGEEFGKSKVIEKVFAKGSITDQEMVLHPKKGGAVSVIFSGSAIKNKEGRNIGFVGISKDITSRKRAGERVLHQGAVLEGINRVFRETLRSETEEEVAKVCLGVAQELTGSKFGFIGEVNRAGRFDTIALSDPGWETCRMPKSDAAVMIRDMEIRGIWGKVLREGQPLIVNDPSSHPDRVGIPQGHPPLTSFLGFPLRHAGRTIGMIALANKESGYDLGNQQDIETLSVPFVEALSRKRAGETLRESEERYRAVVEQSPDGIYLTDVETKRIIEANPAFAQMLGYTLKEMLELSVYDIVAADRGSIDERFRRILGTEGFFVYERQYRSKGGSLLDVWVSVNVISYRGRRVMCTLARDITERKRAQEALQESEERFRAVVEQSTDGIFLADAETKRVIEANPAFARILGYPQEEIIGLPIYDFIVADQADIDRRFQDILRGQAPVSYERPYRRKDGSLVEVGGSSTPISFGNRKAICVIVRDLTERKRAEEVLRESEERYRAVMEQSADGIYLVDVETKRLLEANPAFAQMLGYTTEEIVKLSVYDFVAADRGNIDQRFQNILTMEGSVASERQYRRKDGALLDVWVSVSVISYRGRKVMCTIARDITERKRAGEEREKLIGELTEALDNIKTLRGLVPICASCKKIRDDQGYWQQVEVYVRDRSEAEFSHGLCPDCAKEFLSPINDRKGQEKE